MLSPEQNFQQLPHDALVKAYMAEIMPVEAALKKTDFEEIIHSLVDDEWPEPGQATQDAAIEYIEKMTDGSRIIKFPGISRELASILYKSHISACAILLENSQLDYDSLINKSGYLRKDRLNFLSQPFLQQPDQAAILRKRISGMDAVRTIQVLRWFGLLQNRSEHQVQLAMGAAGGTRDIYYVHTLPKLYLIAEMGRRVLRFGYQRKAAADVIVNDLDPRHQDAYRKMSELGNVNVSGHIGDALKVMSELASNEIAKRNLVTCLRIEPAMIPDVTVFLQHLSPVITDDCDFVLTIGSGDTPEAYKQRIDVVKEMFNVLETSGLKPVLFRLHKGGDIKKQLASLQYGSGWASSYEILYCRLNGAILDSCRR